MAYHIPAKDYARALSRTIHNLDVEYFSYQIAKYDRLTDADYERAHPFAVITRQDRLRAYRICYRMRRLMDYRMRAEFFGVLNEA